MAGTTTVSARIEESLKAQAEEILQTLGISHSVAITALYAQIVMQKGIPFDLRIQERDSTLSFYAIRSAVKEHAEKYGLDRVSLFGSYARGDATGKSDVDLCVDKGSARGFALGGFQDDLARALGKTVDVVSRAAMDERFAARIAQDEVTLYER